MSWLSLKKLREKLLLRYVLDPYAKVLLCLAGALLVLFAILMITGLFFDLEIILDLKYNSPLILVPLYGSLALAFLSLFVGFLLYFHKYRRAKSSGRFHIALSAMLTEKKNDRE